MAGQLWVTDSLGGYLNFPELSAKLRKQAQPSMRFRQFLDAKEAYGKRKDELFVFDKQANVNASGGTLVETQTIPKTYITFTQGTGTLTELGNAIPFTQKLEAFSKWDPKNKLQTALRDDMAKVIDQQVEAQFDACKIRVSYVTDTASVDFQTGGTASTAAAVNMDDYAVKEVIDYLTGTMYAKPYDDAGNYMCIGSTKALRGLHDHLEAIWKYTKYVQSGEIGRYYDCRFVRHTHSSLDNAIGTSDVTGEAYFFGEDNVMEAVSIPEEIRYDSEDFGRSKAVAWYMIAGWQIVWAGDPSNTIIKWDSA